MSIEDTLITVSKGLSLLQSEVRQLKTKITHDPLNAGRRKEQTISGDSITITVPNVYLHPESGTIDTVHTINGATDGRVIVLRAADDSYSITIQDWVNSPGQAGNINLRGTQDQVLDDIRDTIVFMYSEDLGQWMQIDLDHFLNLSDAPDSYATHAGKMIIVNPGETGLTFATPATQYTDEMAQDAVGAILTDGNGINVTYTDEPTPSIVFDLTTLTSNWDIGEDRRILAEGFRARDNEGLRIEDESGTLGVFILSGGKVAVGTTTVATDAVLEVERNQNSVTGIRVENTNTTNTSSRATLDAVSGTVFHRNIAITGYGALIGTGSADKLEFMTDGDTRLWILATGEASFGVLAVANQAQLNVAQILTQGNALRVYRNLAAASTDSPLVNLIQDAATDDQDALRVQQDGSGKLFTFLDGATERWVMADGGAATLTGTLNVTGAVDLDSTLNVDGATTLNTATVKPGTAADTAKVGGMVYNQALTAGNAAVAQSDIVTVSIPANTLSADNMALCWEAFGVWRNGATVAEVRFLFGATQLVTMPISGATGQAWMARGTIHRTGAATQRAVSHGIPGLGSTTFILQSVTPAETLSGAVNFIVRGFSAGPTANDIVIHSLKIWWEDANT